VLIWGLGIAIIATGRATVFLAILFAWQGLVYGSAPLMSWLNVRSEMSAELQRRRETEYQRARRGTVVGVYAGAAAVVVVLAGVFAIGGSQPADPHARARLFATPPRAERGGSPLRELGREISARLDDVTPVSSRPSDEPAEPDATGEPAVTEEPAAPVTDEPTAEPTTAPTANATNAPSSSTPAATPSPAGTPLAQASPGGRRHPSAAP
jgi:hypothetical protein